MSSFCKAGNVHFCRNVSALPGFSTSQEISQVGFIFMSERDLQRMEVLAKIVSNPGNGHLGSNDMHALEHTERSTKP
jgi:hypothetical protein